MEICTALWGCSFRLCLYLDWEIWRCSLNYSCKYWVSRKMNKLLWEFSESCNEGKGLYKDSVSLLTVPGSNLVTCRCMWSLELVRVGLPRTVYPVVGALECEGQANSGHSWCSLHELTGLSSTAGEYRRCGLLPCFRGSRKMPWLHVPEGLSDAVISLFFLTFC